MDQLGLSVLMPARNAARTINSAVRSALLAMPKDSELVVLLDSCTDSTAEVVSRIRDSRLRVVESAEPLGIVQGRNRLLNLAKSETVAVLDADDICLPWRFRLEKAAIDRGYSMVCSTAIIFGKALRPFPVLPQVPLGLKNDEFKLMLTLSNPVVHSTVMMRRSLVADVGDYLNVLPGEDYSLWLRLAASSNRIRRLAVPTVLYRFHQSQITAKFGSNEIQRADTILEGEIRNLCRKFGFSDIREIRSQKLYKRIPLAKLEHHGLRGMNSRNVNQ